MNEQNSTVLIVDDNPSNLELLKLIMEDYYNLKFATSGKAALISAQKHIPDLILLDVMMSEMDGFEVCKRLKAFPSTAKIPVIFVTAMGEVMDEIKGFQLGAVDYIIKPISAPIVLARVKTHLSLVRVDELEETRLAIIQRLGRAAEFKDNETGLHVIRMSHYSEILASAIGMSKQLAKLLYHAAPMHDVGKIGIPDAIILKPGPLDENEWKIMKQHPELGAEIIGNHNSLLLKLAKTIAFSHHEKWDGSGYPRNLVGDNIPLSGRIVAIADVFDALTTVRPYKEAMSINDAVTILQDEAGKHFDPKLIPLFLEKNIFRKILEIRKSFEEKE